MRFINWKGLLLTLIFVVFSLNLSAQINTEKFRKYGEKKGLLFNTLFGFGYSGGNTNYLSVNGNLRLDYNALKNNFFIVTNYEFKETQTEKVANRGFVHLRGVHPFNDVLAVEGFLQQEFNEFILLENRNLVGAGLRTRILNYTPAHDSAGGFRVRLGTGLMHEHELYNIGEANKIEVVKNPFRFTSYLTIDWTISHRVNFWAVGYYQPNLTLLDDFRSILESGIEVWILGKLYLTVDFSYRYNKQPVGDVKHYDVVVTNGVRLTIP